MDCTGPGGSGFFRLVQAGSFLAASYRPADLVGPTGARSVCTPRSGRVLSEVQTVNRETS